MTRLASGALRSRGRRLVAALAPGRLRGRPQLLPARAAHAPRPPLLRGRGAGAVDRRHPVVGGRQGPAAPGPDPRGGRQQPGPARGHRPRGRGSRPVRDRPLVPVPGGRRRRGLLGGAGVAALGAPAGHRREEDVPELERRLPALLGDRPLRPDPPGEGGGVRGLPRHRGGTAGGRSSLSWRTWRPPTSSCGSWTSSSTSPAEPSRRTRRASASTRRGSRGASRTGSRSIARSPTGPARPW